MKLNWIIGIFFVAIFLVSLGGRFSRADPIPADNTAINARDAKSGAPTAMNQSNDPRDVEITRQIRQAIMADKDLSINAKNIKIITVNGMVSLRGPVASDAERSKISAKAAEVAGSDRVHNELEVVTPK